MGKEKGMLMTTGMLKRKGMPTMTCMRKRKEMPTTTGMPKWKEMPMTTGMLKWKGWKGPLVIRKLMKKRQTRCRMRTTTSIRWLQ